jgi:NRPS condensation-like uncharacterized protein
MSEFKGRPFGGVEKLYLALDEIFVKTFALVAELDSKIPDDSVGPALVQLAGRHPQLNYGIAEDNQFQFWFLNVPGNTIPFTSIQIEDNQDWTAILADELVKPFDLAIAPLFRIVILQKMAQSTLIFLYNHSLSDGLSLNIVLQDFLRMLSGEMLHHLPVPLSMDETLNELPEIKSEFIPATSGSLGKSAKNCLPKIYIDKLQFSQYFTTSLVDRSRKEGATVNGALNAAIAFAMSQIDGHYAGRPLITRSPVSARKALNTQNDFALNTVTRNININPVDYDNFWQLARTIKSELQSTGSIDQVRNYIRYFRQRLLHPIAFSQITKGVEASMETDFMVSNLGRMPENLFGKYRIKVLWGPVVVSGNGTEQTVGAVTIGGQLSLINTSASRMPALLTEAANILAVSLNN